jgi:hypothetical protein
LPDKILDTVIELQTPISNFNPTLFHEINAQRSFQYLLGRLSTEINPSITTWKMEAVAGNEHRIPESKLVRNINESRHRESREYSHPTVEEDAKSDSPPGTAVAKVTAEEREGREIYPPGTRKRRGELKRRCRGMIGWTRRMEMGTARSRVSRLLLIRMSSMQCMRAKKIEGAKK